MKPLAKYASSLASAALMFGTGLVFPAVSLASPDALNSLNISAKNRPDLVLTKEDDPDSYSRYWVRSAAPFFRARGNSLQWIGRLSPGSRVYADLSQTVRSRGQVYVPIVFDGVQGYTLYDALARVGNSWNDRWDDNSNNSNNWDYNQDRRPNGWGGYWGRNNDQNNGWNSGWGNGQNNDWNNRSDEDENGRAPDSYVRRRFVYSAPVLARRGYGLVVVGNLSRGTRVFADPKQNFQFGGRTYVPIYVNRQLRYTLLDALRDTNN